MGAHESQAMVEARRLITTQGMSAYEAANVAGVSRQAIYMATWYKDWKFQQQTRNSK